MPSEAHGTFSLPSEVRVASGGVGRLARQEVRTCMGFVLHWGAAQAWLHSASGKCIPCWLHWLRTRCREAGTGVRAPDKGHYPSCMGTDPLLHNTQELGEPLAESPVGPEGHFSDSSVDSGQLQLEEQWSV